MRFAKPTLIAVSSVAVVLMFEHPTFARCNLSLTLDQSGSMIVVRPSTGQTRCHDAIHIAREMVTDFKNGRPLVMDWSRDPAMIPTGVPDPLNAIATGYGFDYATDCPALTDRKVQIVGLQSSPYYIAPAVPVPGALPAADFTDPDTALAALNALSPATACTGNTALADAICLSGRGTVPDGTTHVDGIRRVKIITDGDENFSAFANLTSLIQRGGDPTKDCRIPTDTDDPTEPFDLNSWQDNVLSFLRDDLGFDEVEVRYDILHFLDDPLDRVAGAPAIDRETGRPRPGTQTLVDQAFFKKLASTLGGTYVVADDVPTGPQMTVVAGISNSGTCGLSADAGRAIPVGAGVYTAVDHLDFIRIAFFGIHNPASGLGTDCASEVRRSLLTRYSHIFHTGCVPGDVGCPAGIRHLFRLSETKAASAIFAALVGGGATVNNFCNVNGGLSPGACTPLGGLGKNGRDFLDNDPLRITCSGNGIINGEQVCGDAGQLPPPGAVVRRTPPVGPPAWLPGGQCIQARRACVVSNDCRDFAGDTDTCSAITGRCQFKHLACSNTAQCTAVVAGDFCGRHGTLGALVTVHVPDPFDVPPPETYPIGLCTSGVNALLPAVKSTCAGPCPSGGPSFGGRCFGAMFRDATGALNANCVTAVSTTRCPILTPAGTDCRGANLWVRKPSGDLAIDTTFAPGLVSPPLPPVGRYHVGGYYKIHTTTKELTGTGTCNKSDSEEQVNCLAGTASPCSMGFVTFGAAVPPGDSIRDLP